MTTFLKYAGMTLVLAVLFAPGALAQEAGGLELGKMGAGFGAGLCAIGAGLGIGRLAAAAGEGIARQPSAASNITGAVNLPLFLLEGVAIIGLGVCFAILFF